MISYAGATVNVVGLGATGLSFVRHLRARGARVAVFDGDAKPSGIDVLRRDFPEVAHTQFDVHTEMLPSSDWIALSPGVPRASHALKTAITSGVEVLGDIELFAREFKEKGDLIAITGSNGKTTTALLTGAILRDAGIENRVAGNVGLPVLDAAADASAPRVWVLEISSFQLESTTALHGHTATVLNVTANHLDRYESFFAYASAKARICQGAKRYVANRGDIWSRSMKPLREGSLSFGLDAPKDASEFGLTDSRNNSTCISKGAVPIAGIDELRIRGTHNVLNAMAALALADSFAVSEESARQTLRTFAGAAHRYEWLGKIRGVDVINDSKATTTVATIAALTGSTSPVWLIAGGDAKGQSFDEFARHAAQHCRAVHLIGKDADAISAALAVNGVSHRKFATLEDAVASALGAANSGDTLLLSPACASWDMFQNFEHRARAFESAVRAWAVAHGAEFAKERAHA